MVPNYLAPTELAVSPTPLHKVLLLGNCMFDLWQGVIAGRSPGVEVRHSIYDYAVEVTSDADYDLRLVQVPLRIVYPEMATMRGRLNDPDYYEEAYRQARSRMGMLIGMIRNASPDRPTFFLNYLYPQQSVTGRLLPRYDLSNPTFFIQRLNRALHDIAADFPGGHILDLDQISAAHGRHLMQDDGVWVLSHAGTVTDEDMVLDGERLEAEAPLSERYPQDVSGFVDAAWGEALAMLRTLRGTDRVKMICVDLDDTLWRGVLAEQDEIDYRATEGWPIGFAEALLICKQRGILLAIVSKNDEAQAASVMERAFHGRITLDDFAIRKINWQPKPTNVADAIREANILPDAVLYIDDNPVERAAVKALLPQVRTLGAPHLDWRRILLWSPETQVPAISEESGARTEMVQAQVRREEDRASASYEDFLAALDLSIDVANITSIADPAFARALELLNKTNQFNTTGERWSETDAGELFASGGRWWTVRARDRYTEYGLIAVIVQSGLCLRQFVMSCRVFGLQVERAALATVRRLAPEVEEARLIETPKNGPCRTLYSLAGWSRQGDTWVAGPAQPPPSHVAIRVA